ncbi:hypothetical protein L1267_12165 [Pseudoalteromonas sp. OFAV1]|uniref:hypothetical protein n=1 Tax=Pseudoalteromonas sp. OFAV1 TaxID=2908892 RepID=UPI001F267769|nr:hypothetical protein [Pseudoalteromonas sp. OFAV1]MCF2901146.1 hypothetical protein [Pseudoalteromonas sp. OFAV1]
MKLLKTLDFIIRLVFAICATAFIADIYEHIKANTFDKAFFVFNLLKLVLIAGTLFASIKINLHISEKTEKEPSA